jgi:hypothetical protein
MVRMLKSSSFLLWSSWGQLRGQKRSFTHFSVKHVIREGGHQATLLCITTTPRNMQRQNEARDCSHPAKRMKGDGVERTQIPSKIKELEEHDSSDSQSPTITRQRTCTGVTMVRPRNLFCRCHKA